MSGKDRPTTRLCTYSEDAITVRGRDLVGELMGRVTFTQMMFLEIMGRLPDATETAIVDAVLVTVMEHGLTPSTIAARLTHHGAPEAFQAGVAAGLLGIGGQFVGTMEDAAALLQRLVDDADGVEAAAHREVEACKRERRRMPGFGHNLHGDDPRTPRLLEIAEEQGVPGTHIAALRTLGRVVDAVYRRHITINATGAIAAVLLEIGVPVRIMRGFAAISRAAGIVAHLAEEQVNPAARAIWSAAADAVPYEEEGP